MLVQGVHVKQEQPSRFRILTHPAEHILNIRKPRQVVQTVQHADGHVHCTVQFQTAHVLAHILNGQTTFALLLHCLVEHVSGAVHPDHVIAPACHSLRQSAGAAGKIQQHTVLHRMQLADQLVQICRPGFVIYVLRQQIVVPGKDAVAPVTVHVRDPSCG